MSFFSITTPQKYIPIWKKYRPAILRLMIDSEKKPQTYQLSDHEFRDADNKPKGGYSFELSIHKGNAVNPIGESAIAKELLYVLQHSAKAAELSDEGIYHIGMDRNFNLQVTREEPAPEIDDSPESSDESDKSEEEPTDQ